MSVIPKQLKFSEALKPVSVASQNKGSKFLPITSGAYGPVSNNIIRVPINSGNMLDLKNMVLRFALTSPTGAVSQLDGSASSIIQRLNWLGPDGASLELIDNYNKLYGAISQLEKTADFQSAVGAILEGSGNGNYSEVYIQGNATASTIELFADSKSSGTLSLLASVDATIDAGNWTIDNNGTSITIQYNSESQVINIAAGGTAIVNGVQFTLAAAGASLTVAGRLLNATTQVNLPSQGDFTAKTFGDVFASATTKYYAIPILSMMTALETYYPAMVVAGGGCVLEITLAPTREAFHTLNSASSFSADYSVNAVEVIIPTLAYPDTVVNQFRQLLQQTGSISMSSRSFQTFVYPYTASQTGLEIPLSMRARSLKALYFFFQSNPTDTNVMKTTAREAPASSGNYQLRIGGQYYPNAPVQYNCASTSQNIAEPYVELLKSFAKLNDIRLGNVITPENFVGTQLTGGMFMLGLDLESDATAFLESGVDTATNSLNMYLQITQCPATAGNVYVYAMFDNTLTVLANGNLVQTH